MSMAPFTMNYIRSVLDYNPDTGLFVWKKQMGARAKVGDVVGYYDKDGYVILQLNGKKHKSHRLAWMYMTGEWPEDEIDHKDGAPANNVWSNLREATRSDNVVNSDRASGESGFRGVKFDSSSSTWRARIGYGHQRRYVGAYGTAEEAYRAYLAAAETVHGKFAFHTRNSEEENTSWQP